MNLFGSPNIEKMAAEHDYDGLYKLLEHRDTLVRLQAAQALADMNDGTGWRFLIDALRNENNDIETRSVAAAMLGELGHPRAVPVLGEVLQKLRYAPSTNALAEAVRQALESIDSLEAEDALRDAGYEPVIKSQSHTVIEYEDQYTRQVMVGSELRFLSAEQHLNNAVELREAELTERGLVEDSLVLWLSPDLSYAWYLRGVLFEDLERSFEALLAYQHAVELDPTLREAREALDELKEEVRLPVNEADLFLSNLASRDWAERRDGAAGLGDLALRGDPRAGQAGGAGQAGDMLIALLDDEEREVRHAALEALGRMADRRAVPAILAMDESSWLVRFSILQSLAWLGAVDGLISALRREMTRIQERNPIFSSQKDPMLEVEYEALMEIGARALERTGDIEALLSLAEDNAWEEMEEEVEVEEDEIHAPGAGRFSMGYEQEFETLDDDSEEDEDLSSYVDEVAEMAVVALERLAMPALPDLPEEILKRLAAVPDLTLINLEEEQDQPVLVRDLAGLREAAAAELRRRAADHP